MGPLDAVLSSTATDLGDLCAAICAQAGLGIELLEKDLQEIEWILRGPLDEILLDLDQTLAMVYAGVERALDIQLRDLAYDLYWISPDDMDDFFPDGSPPPPDERAPRKSRSRKTVPDSAPNVSVDIGRNGHSDRPSDRASDPSGQGAVHVAAEGARTVNVFVDCPDLPPRETIPPGPSFVGSGRPAGVDRLVGIDLGPAARPALDDLQGMPLAPGLNGNNGQADNQTAGPAFTFISAPGPGPEFAQAQADDQAKLKTLEQFLAGQATADTQPAPDLLPAGDHPDLSAQAPRDPILGMQQATFAAPASTQVQAKACGGMVALRQVYARLGMSAMTELDKGPGPGSLTMQQTLSVAWKLRSENDDIGNYLEEWQQKIVSNPEWAERLQLVSKRTEPLLGGRYDLAEQLKAAVVWLEMLDSFSIDFARGWFAGQRDQKTAQAKGGFGAGPLKLIGIEGGTEATTSVQAWGDKTRTINISGRVKMVVISMLETARWFSDQAQAVNLPSISEGASAYMRGGMSQETLDCLLKMHGADPELWSGVIDAQRTGLGPMDLVALYRRGKIGERELWDRIRQTGVSRSEDAAGMYQLSEAIPPISDLIRFMVRDVEDASVVERYDLDAEFAAKWAGPLSAWGHAQGTSDEIARRYWRAHWDYPSNPQLFEMFHRLAPDMLPAGRQDLAVTIEDVKTVLAVNDVLPFWRERIAEVAYSPLTRVDAQRMFMTGVLDRAGIIKAYRSIGYSPENAALLADFTSRRRLDYLQNARPSKLYRRSAISRETWRKQMAVFEMRAEEAEDILSRLDAEQRQATAKACIGAVRHEFLLGGLDQEDLADRLGKISVPLEQRVLLAEQWACEKRSRQKALPAATLCKWFAAGLISEEDYRTRLVRLGFTSADTLTLVAFCKGSEVKRLTTRKERDEDKQKKDLERRKKALENADVRSRSQEARAKRTLDKEATAEARRKGKLRKAAYALANVFAGTTDEAARMMQDATAYLMESWELPQVEAEALVLDAIRAWDGKSLQGWKEVLEDLARQDAEFDLAPDEAGVPAGPIR